MPTLKEISVELVDDINSTYSDLKILNLSNNEISKIENLELICSLVKLNLSGNKIEVIENLSLLPNLTELNLSRNRLKRLGDLSEEIPNIEILNVSDNFLDSLEDIAGLSVLQHLTSLDLQSNPLCALRDYRQEILRCLPNLVWLDGALVTAEERCKDIPPPHIPPPAPAPPPSFEPPSSPVRSSVTRSPLRASAASARIAAAYPTYTQSQQQQVPAPVSSLSPPTSPTRRRATEPAAFVPYASGKPLYASQELALPAWSAAYRDAADVPDSSVTQKSSQAEFGEAKSAFEQERASLERELLETQREAKMNAATIEMLKAEVEIEQTATKMARAALAKVEQNEHRLRGEVQRTHDAQRGVRQQLLGLLDIKARFEESMQVATARMLTMGRRVSFAVNRVDLVKNTLRAEKRAESLRLTNDLPSSPKRASASVAVPTLPRVRLEQEYSIRDLPALQEALAALRQEVERLTHERDAFARKAHASAAAMAEQSQEQLDAAHKAKMQAEAALASLENDLHRARDEHSTLQAKAQMTSKTLNVSEQERRLLEARVAELTHDLERVRRKMREDAETELVKVREEATGRERELAAELADVKREAAKSAVAVRHLEKEFASQKARDEAGERARLEYLEEQLTVKDKELRSLRKERSELLATVRQFERSGIRRAISSDSAALSPPAHSPQRVPSASGQQPARDRQGDLRKLAAMSVDLLLSDDEEP